jgi:hypothetical protein
LCKILVLKASTSLQHDLLVIGRGYWSTPTHSTGKFTCPLPLHSPTWSLHRCDFDGITATRGGKTGKFGN